MTDDTVLLRREIANLTQKVIDLKAQADAANQFATGFIAGRDAAIAEAVERERAACEEIARTHGKRKPVSKRSYDEDTANSIRDEERGERIAAQIIADAIAARKEKR
jgi:hypothetical protein